MTFSFEDKLWQWEAGEGTWHFVTLPKEHSEVIKEVSSSHQRKGFGSVKVNASIGNSSWKTSIFPDSKRKAYVLPIKKSIRDKEKLFKNDEIEVEISLIDF